MRRLLRPFLQAFALLALGLTSAEAAEPRPPQPEGFWMGPPHGITPAGLTGATVLDARALSRLIAEEHPLVLDVAMAEVKPPGLAPDALWRPVHRSIPGSVWMPGAGAGALDAAREARLDARVLSLSGGDRNRPIVAFCHRDCWASWNAAKRLMRLGYQRLYWLPDGVEGWQEAYDTAVVVQDSAWALP